VPNAKILLYHGYMGNLVLLNVVPVFCWPCCPETSLFMSSNPLKTLKKGFAHLLGKIKDRKDKLNAKLSQGEPIPPTDEEWLDHEGNSVDEECILEILNLALDYEVAVAELDNHGYRS
jgi:hypothetical protein